MKQSAQEIISKVRRDLLGVVAEVFGDERCSGREFLHEIVQASPMVHTSLDFARRLGVNVSTLNSRLYRSGMGGPKTFLTSVNMVHYASLWADPDRSLRGVALACGWPHTSTFARHIKGEMSGWPGNLREHYTPEDALGDFRGLITDCRFGLRNHTIIRECDLRRGPLPSAVTTRQQDRPSAVVDLPFAI